MEEVSFRHETNLCIPKIPIRGGLPDRLPIRLRCCRGREGTGGDTDRRLLCSLKSIVLMTTHDSQKAPRLVRLIQALIFLVFVEEASVAALRDSVTIDEFVGLPVGLYTLQALDFRSESMNPPFFRSFAALPLLLLGGPDAPRIPPMNEVNDWAMGYRFMEDYGAFYQELFVPARCMVILTGAILGALVLEWATSLYGY